MTSKGKFTNFETEYYHYKIANCKKFVNSPFKSLTGLLKKDKIPRKHILINYSLLKSGISLDRLYIPKNIDTEFLLDTFRAPYFILDTNNLIRQL